uniref:Protein krueppel n=1 Tax=Pectinophora gossypiella TaxID=13191 RepID=A0A1E1WL68_PECGO
MSKVLFSENLTTNNICRICLLSVEDGTDLFSEDGTSKNILEKIHLCFQIILNYEEYLPNYICNNCCKELECANNFRVKCITFEERFIVYNNETVEDQDDSDIKQTEDDPELRSNLMPVENDSEVHLAYNANETYKSQYNDGYKCDICNKILKTKVSLLKHIVSMHQMKKHVGRITGSGVNRRYHCTKCVYSTPHSQTLVNHMRRHNGERPYHCKCGKSFTQSASLTAHQKTHSNMMYFTCATCGKQFRHAYSLKTHLRVHETGSFKCSICQKALKTQKSLQGHMNRHYNIRNYNCEDCGATFITCPELLNHRKKHSVEKTAECHLCGYKTNAKKNLVIHLKRHAGDKAYKCEVCNKTAYTQSDLRRHQRVHSREKPYPCPACSQHFSHSSTLNQHARNVHGLTYRWGEYKTESGMSSVKQEKHEQ